MTRIAIDPGRPVGRLDRKVFGGFVEHLGRWNEWDRVVISERLGNRRFSGTAANSLPGAADSVVPPGQSATGRVL